MSGILDWLWALPLALFMWMFRKTQSQAEEISELKKGQEQCVTFEDMVRQNDTFFKKMDVHNEKMDDHYRTVDRKIDTIHRRIDDITPHINPRGE